MSRGGFEGADEFLRRAGGAEEIEAAATVGADAVEDDEHGVAEIARRQRLDAAAVAGESLGEEAGVVGEAVAEAPAADAVRGRHGRHLLVVGPERGGRFGGLLGEALPVAVVGS